MATKKAKREAAAAKRSAYLAEVAAEGLEAQKADKAWREQEAARLQAFAKDINFKHHEILARAGLR